MGDLLQSQIRDSCRLALPEGLKDLMSDISREVLRTQPQNLYQFIADYLSALLVAREHLFIAARVCDDVCKNRCCQELEDELRGLSLSEEDVQETLTIVAEYFSSGAVKEGNLLQKLMKKTSIGQEQLPPVQEAVRREFLRHQVNQTAPIDSSSTDSELDETTIAAKHTLKIYKKVTEQPDINYDCVASKIQAAYRAYNVRRQRAHAPSDEPTGKRTDTIDKVRFHVKQQDKPVAELVNVTKRCTSKCSSESLAGSFISLPPYKPYRIDQRPTIAEREEVEKEKEHANFDYVTNLNSRSPQECQEYNEIGIKKEKKTISFHNLLKVVEVDYNEVSDEVDETGYEIDESELEEQSSDEEKVIEIAGHSDDFGDEMPITEDLTKEVPNEILIEWNDDEFQETEMKRTTEDWNRDDSAEVTTDDDVDVDDVNRVGEIDCENDRDVSSEISDTEKNDDGEDIDESIEALADDMDVMVEDQANDGNIQN